MFITDYLIVVALDEETRYTYDVLQQELGLRLSVLPADAALVSALATVPLVNKRGRYDELVVVASPGEMGHSAMAASLPAVIERWRPRDIILIGISGSLDAENLILGDVLVPMRIFGYAQAKIHFSDGADNWTFRTMGERSTTAVRTEIRAIGLDPTLRKGWEDKCLEAGKGDPLLASRIARPPKLHIHENDALGTGNFVVASSAFGRMLQERVSKTIQAVDMEAGGVFEAMAKIEWNSRVSVFRGISDFADEQKSKLEAGSKDGWRKYAMQNAVRLVCELIRQRSRWFTSRTTVSAPYEILTERHPDSFNLCKQLLLDRGEVGAFNLAYCPFLRRPLGSPELSITVEIKGPLQSSSHLLLRERPSPLTETLYRSEDPGRIALRRQGSDQPFEIDLLCSAPEGGLEIEINIEDEFGRTASKLVKFGKSGGESNAL